MSDSIKKYHELVEDGIIEDKTISSTAENLKFIYESPDGKKVTRRPFGGDITEREVIVMPITEVKKKAYRLLCEYDEEVIRMAMKIIDIGE